MVIMTRSTDTVSGTFMALVILLPCQIKDKQHHHNKDKSEERDTQLCTNMFIVPSLCHVFIVEKKKAAVKLLLTRGSIQLSKEKIQIGKVHVTIIIQSAFVSLT